MESLFARAVEIAALECRLPSGRIATLRRIAVRFGRASPEFLPPGTLEPSYIAKPLVTFNGAAMFGELAVVRWLETDGWTAVWLDTFHGRKVWRDMPNKAAPIELPSAQKATYDRIVAENGDRASGMFDVMAWKEGHTIFVEYKAPRDRTGRSEAKWIDAALRSGVSQNDLFVVMSA